MDEWVNMQERMPRVGEDVLFYISYGRQHCFLAAYLSFDGQLYIRVASQRISFSVEDCVVYWRSLPEAPKEVQYE